MGARGGEGWGFGERGGPGCRLRLPLLQVWTHGSFFPQLLPFGASSGGGRERSRRRAFEGPGFKWSGGQGRNAVLALAGGVGVRSPAQPPGLAYF